MLVLNVYKIGNPDNLRSLLASWQYQIRNGSIIITPFRWVFKILINMLPRVQAYLRDIAHSRFLSEDLPIFLLAQH